ncbi:hypothetical protein PoB_005574600 [Plakobranchus ocellatus]|uniref:Uncharacterized protein n=1 Tax=Plakobranchus ocellatus TaxID=259542 RepID=A0AAV4C952_9GAST|nr:hypothetical protein PoB_005574600 [Plakobranchus ocellatus]
MSRNKMFLLMIVTALTAANVVILRRFLRPSGQKQSAVDTTTNLSPDILVMYVEDVHPVAHLQEAYRLGQQLSTQRVLQSPAANKPLETI